MNINSQQLREKFLKFFEKNDHKIISSAPLIPSDKEQLAGKEKVLFTSAGMQPLIPYLLGKPHSQGNKLANIQKCLRTDDIEEVSDNTHHTFFEMLGNWSLGAYWKDEAIRLSFEFLTQELEIPIKKLAITVFAGDVDAPRDEESAKEWEKQGMPKDRIFYFGKEYNWWPTGEKSGPCGPDTEMFFWTKEKEPEGKPNEDSRWVEIWNDVFMQFNRKENGTLEDLSQRNVDTGMGLERTLAVLNGKDNNYETDLFLPIMEELRRFGNKYSVGSERIITDHLRAAIFLLAEGISSDPKDPYGSVVRRLITNAVTQENKLLGVINITGIIDVVTKHYGAQYPELKENKQHILQELKNTLIILEKVKNGPAIVAMRRKIKNAEPFEAGRIAYFYHQSHGIPETIILGEASNLTEDFNNFLKGYKEEFRKHQEASKVK